MKWIKTTDRLPNKTGEYFINVYQHISQNETPKNVWEYVEGEDDKVWLNSVDEWLDETPTMLDELNNYFETNPREQVEKDWAKTAEFDEVGPTVEEFLHQTNEILDSQRVDWLENYISHYQWEYMLGINLREFVDKRLRNETE